MSRKHRIRAYCARCRHEQYFTPVKVNHWAHLALTAVTVGLWVVSWAAISLGQLLRPWRCRHCGWHHPEFRALGSRTAGQLGAPEARVRSGESRRFSEG